MLSFWDSFSTDWKRRFAEHSTLKENSLVFEVSEEQKEYMESLGTLKMDMYNPKSVTFETVDNCIICTATYDDLSWMEFPSDDDGNHTADVKELMDYLNELKK